MKNSNRIISYVSLVICLLYCSLSTGQHVRETESWISETPRVVNPRFREEASPQGTARTNPPILKIPLQARSRKNTYDFRLSMSKDFDDSELIEASQLPFAIFNPHRKLSTGRWYWQYRYADGDWSALLEFEISSETAVFISPSFSDLEPKVPVEHPRSIVFKDDMEELRKRNLGSKDATEIIIEADRYLKLDPPKETEGISTLIGATESERKKLAMDASKRLGSMVSAGIESLVRAYVLTGDAKYRGAAIKWAFEVSSWDPNGVSMANNFGDSDCMLSLAMAYDVFFDDLTEGQKSKILASIEVRGNRFYNIWINNLEAKIFSGHVWQHIMERLLKVSLATFHELPASHDWFTLIYELWLARAPILGPNDGGWWNGSHYFELNALTLLEIPLILNRLTGIDFFRSQFYDNNSKWLIYSFPPNSYSEGFGNGTEKQFGQKMGVVAYADALSRLHQDPYASYYADLQLKAMGLKLEDDDVFRWFRCRWLLPDRPQSLQELALPLARVFPETGTVNMHSDLEDFRNNLMVSMRSSTYGSTSHAHADQNSFNIQFGGERIFYNSGHRPAMGVPHYTNWFKATKGHNTILIDGKEQPIASSESYGWIARFLTGDQISYALGDASKAYDNILEVPQTAGMKLFRRHLAFVRPNIIVIYDELESDHEAEWSWLLHSMEETKLDIDGTLTCQTSNASAKAYVFGSSEVHIEIGTKFDPEPVNFRGQKDENGELLAYKDQWHINAKSSQKVDKMRYLTVIQVTPNGLSAMDFRRIDSSEWLIGDWEIRAEMDVAATAFLQVTSEKASEGLFFAGKDINFGTDTLEGKIQGSTILARKVNGKFTMEECIDIFPLSKE